MELEGPRVGPASGTAKQLVLLLHGVGASGDDLIGLAPDLARSLPDAVFVSPHGAEPFDMAPMGRQWFSLQKLDPPTMLRGAETAAPVLDRYIDTLLQEFGLTDAQLALFGFSQGCMMALHVGLRRAGPCAGVLGYSGMLLGDAKLATEARAKPPVLLVHGADDEVVPAVCLQHATHMLKSIEVPVEAHLRPGLGHGIDPEGIRLARDFLSRCFALN